MKLTSEDFKTGQSIPRKLTCEGEDSSPQLAWTDVPPKTQSFALIMDDPDAPAGTWVHWVLYDIPGGGRSLAAGIAEKDVLPDGTKHGASWGVDSFERAGYGGPCPPPGKPHRYFFKLYALSKMLNLPPKADVFKLAQAMKGHILGQAELIGLYKR